MPLPHSFKKAEYDIHGTWDIVEGEGRLIIFFFEDCETRDRPDVEMFLSPQTMASVTGDNAVDGSFYLGFMKSVSGAQEYETPVGTDLSEYKTVLIHCEKYFA